MILVHSVSKLSRQIKLRILITSCHHFLRVRLVDRRASLVLAVVNHLHPRDISHVHIIILIQIAFVIRINILHVQVSNLHFSVRTVGCRIWAHSIFVILTWSLMA